MYHTFDRDPKSWTLFTLLVSAIVTIFFLEKMWDTAAIISMVVVMFFVGVHVPVVITNTILLWVSAVSVTLIAILLIGLYIPQENILIASLLVAAFDGGMLTFTNKKCWFLKKRKE